MICWTMMVTTETLGRLAPESRRMMNLTRNSRSLRPGFSGCYAAFLRSPAWMRSPLFFERPFEGR